MILLVDIGNTRVKWGMLVQGALNVAEETFPTSGMSTGLDKFFLELEKPTAVFISNVAGKKIAVDIEEWITKTWGVVPHFISTGSEYAGIRNAYVKPEQLGVDRWLAMIGAFQYLSGSDNALKKESYDNNSPLCIIDCGSAVTIDVLTGDGKHQGGLIVPGLRLMRDSLMEKIQITVNGKTKGTISLLARDTRGAISSGTLYTLVSAIDRITADLKTEMKKNLTCMITGGDAEDLLPLLSGEYVLRPNLVLDGLAIIANNTKAETKKEK